MHMCAGTRIDIRIYMSIIDMCIGMCVDMWIDMCVGMSMDMQKDMHVGMCVDMLSRNAG